MRKNNTIDNLHLYKLQQITSMYRINIGIEYIRSEYVYLGVENIVGPTSTASRITWFRLAYKIISFHQLRL